MFVNIIFDKELSRKLEGKESGGGEIGRITFSGTFVADKGRVFSS